MSTGPEQINQQYDDENKSLTSEMAQNFYNKIKEYKLYTTVLDNSFDQNLNNTQKEQIKSASITYIVQQFHSLGDLQKACASEDKNLLSQLALLDLVEGAGNKTSKNNTIDLMLNQSQLESIKWLNDWRNSPIGKAMLMKSAGADFDYYNQGRTKSLQENLSNPTHFKTQKYHPDGIPISGVNTINPLAPILPNTKKYKTYIYDYGLSSPSTMLHETGHAEDEHGKYIPKADKALINSYRPKTFNETPFSKTDEGKLLSTKDIKGVEKRLKMYSSPKEVRQLLNQIRFLEHKDNNRIYDPFNEKVTPAMFEKMKQKVYENEKKDVLKLLQKNFTDEQIIEMLNTVSYNDADEINDDNSQIA